MVVLVALSGSVACVGTKSPTAPAPVTASKTVELTVRVLTRATEHAVTGAMVYQNGAVVGVTTENGELRTNVPFDSDFRIDVAAPGFVGFGAAGTVRGDERWTFYLEPAE